MKRSFRLAKIAGIPVEINYTWFIIFGLITWTASKYIFPLWAEDIYGRSLPEAVYWIMGISSAVLLFASLLAHELSHSIVAIRHNLPIKGITLFIFGGVAHMEEEPKDPSTELKMALAGPAMSLFLGSIFLLLFMISGLLDVSISVLIVLRYLWIINFVVVVFNMIPGFPLDGGRVLRAGLWIMLKDLKRATRIATNFGKGFAYFLMFAGLLEILRFGSIISGFWFIFIGFFLLEAAEMSYQQVVMKTTLSGIRVKDIMTKDAITVPADTSLQELVDNYFFRFRFHSFPVISEDSLLGLITLHDVKDISREKWPQKTAREAMIPVSGSIITSRDAEAISALSKMAKNGIGRLLVIENSKLVGILSQRDIMSLFEFKNHLGS